MSTIELTNRRILVTGGAGFVGSHLATALADENNVRVLDSLASGSRSNVPADATLIDGDVRDEETVRAAAEDVDLIFHEAALVSVEQSIADPTRSHAINVDGTLAVLEAARTQDARVVLASSAAIYGHPETVPIAESAPKRPTSPYGIEKHVIDQYAQQYHDLYGLETVPLRYFNVYGPGQVAGDYSGVISIFVEQALAGEDITVDGDGSQTRDFVFVDDVVQANLRAATTDAVGQPYNIGTGSAVSIRELAELVRERTDAGSDIVHTEARDGDIEHSRADVSSAREELGFEPTVSFRAGLGRTIDWYRSRQD